jgi:predicted metal-binding protein
MTIIGAQPCQFNEGNTDLVALVNGTCSECRQLGLSDACSRL